MSKPQTPPIESPAGRGVPEKDGSTGIVNPESGSDGQVPKTSGAPKQGKEPLPNPVADRNTEGVRQGGMTPRPTTEPITGEER